MQDTPLVSVIIPCYNLGAYLDEAVQSVLDQTFQDFEIIIIDDGSTDPATQFLFTSFSRPKCRIFRTENRGVMQARNFGISKAKGSFISCLDADDLYEPRFLERTVDLLRSTPDVAFASTWLHAFGALNFDWQPRDCTLPRLLLEDTVCTAALMRKEAVTAVGGYDPNVPLACHEDWDLSISLVEQGFRGEIIPEFLFRYRVRHTSASSVCRAPENHVRLIRYLVEKHAASYRSHLPTLLEQTEQKILQMLAEIPKREQEHDGDKTRLAAILNAVLASESWRMSYPLRRLLGSMKFRSNTRRRFGSRRLSVVLTSGEDALDMLDSWNSISGLPENDELIVVDRGSADPLTRHLLQGFEAAGARLLHLEPVTEAEARKEGLMASRGEHVFAISSGDRVDPELVEQSLARLREDSAIAFVMPGLTEPGVPGFVWQPNSGLDHSIASTGRHAFPLLRRSAYQAVGGYDATFPDTEVADGDLLIRLSQAGFKGRMIERTVARQPRTPRARTAVVRELFARHRPFYENEWKAAYLGLDLQRRYLESILVDPHLRWVEEDSTIAWGTFRRVQPISSTWGLDRGTPVDRFYIERFLDEFRADIHGRTLEVKDAEYTRTFGSAVEQSDVLDIASGNPAATIVADLSENGSLPADTFDCFVLTQTLHFIYPVRKAVQNAFQTLKPGGVLLATIPCVSRIDYEPGVEGDFWRMTTAAVRKLFEETFGEGQVEIRSYGNVLACCAFLMGLAAEELEAKELEYFDRYFPLIVCVRAVKQTKTEGHGRMVEAHSAEEPAGAILLYHSIGDRHEERWNLSLNPELFRSQLAQLAASFRVVPLAQLASELNDKILPDRSIAITFDDGYMDNLTTALPILKELAIPATFFISGDGATGERSFWWEELSVRAAEAGLDEEEFRRMHAQLMKASPEERSRLLASLPSDRFDYYPRMQTNDLSALIAEPLAEIGAHGWSHRALGGLTEEEQHSEIRRSIDGLSRAGAGSVRLFAYPFGDAYDDVTVRLLRNQGITCACAVAARRVTMSSDPMRLPRLEVGDWTGEELQRRLDELLHG